MAKKKATIKTTSPFYHITAIENVNSIFADGLKGSKTPRNRGKAFNIPSICVLTSGDERLTDAVAVNQVWSMEDIKEYAVLEISPAGVSGRVVQDNVNESTAVWQRVIEQECIEPKYLKHVNTRVLNYLGKAASLLACNLERKEKWTQKEWELAERYVAPICVAHRRIFEARQEKRRLTPKEWEQVTKFFPGSALKDVKPTEPNRDRRGMKKTAKK